ncbi:hypothetical protein [Asticcacaulis sp. 201]|uniref:hypothetical protein n=1 Tax=Asticcacaulis sp. 201 TaxID=3028787 RepID=UPI00291701C6|nr:hypothetical protein [Asticcacaulis sp. 201]MDV6330402.1 hypothetical protein [Asticcacaulis sp. 201]
MKALAAACLFLSLATSALAQAGNEQALQIANASAKAGMALKTLTQSAQAIRDPELRQAALAALDDTACIHHRAGLTARDKTQIIDRLVAAGWLSAPRDPADRLRLTNGVFPPLHAEDSACPLRPQPFLSAPGGNMGSHHDWPGGLALHEAFNLRQSHDLVQAWHDESGIILDQDLLTAAVIWHDWGKALVFQWREDGSEQAEIQMAGTGAHHVLALAEAISRGLPPRLIQTMACAHAAPLDGDQKKVSAWLEAATIIAQKDAQTALYTGAPWPPECFVHTVSDQNWIVSEPAAQASDAALAQVAHRFGLVPRTAYYNWRLRLPALAQIGPLRLWQASQTGGDAATEKLIIDAGLPVKGR